MTLSEAPSCVVTYNHNSDDSRDVIYNRNIFILQATDKISLGLQILT
jgi:hypothetical protein